MSSPAKNEKEEGRRKVGTQTLTSSLFWMLSSWFRERKGDLSEAGSQPGTYPQTEELSSNAAHWERVRVLPHRLEGTIAFDCYGEVSRGFQLHSENLTPGGQKYAWVRSRSSSNCQLDSGTLWNPKSTGQQNATEADILRPSVHHFVGQLDRDRQVQVVAYASALGLVGRVHWGPDADSRVRRGLLLQTGNEGAFSMGKRTSTGPVIGY